MLQYVSDPTAALQHYISFLHQQHLVKKEVFIDTQAMAKMAYMYFTSILTVFYCFAMWSPHNSHSEDATVVNT